MLLGIDYPKFSTYYLGAKRQEYLRSHCQYDPGSMMPTWFHQHGSIHILASFSPAESVVRAFPAFREYSAARPSPCFQDHQPWPTAGWAGERSPQSGAGQAWVTSLKATWFNLIPPGGQDLVATWLHLLLIWERRPWCGLADCHDGGSRSLKLTPWSRLPQQRRLLLPPLHWTLQHFLHFSPAACCQVWIKQLGRCDRETIELANNSNDSIVRTAGRASKKDVRK